MTDSMQRRAAFVFVLSALMLTLAIGLLTAGTEPGSTEGPSRRREVAFVYQTEITVDDGKAKHVEAWIPLPRQDSFQKVSGLSIESPVRVDVIDQPTRGNRVAHLTVDAPVAHSIPVTIHFNVRRVEEAADRVEAERDLPQPRDGTFSADLGPDRLVPIDGEIARVSARIGHSGASAHDQARAIYNYVIANMTYDKTGTGWGRGDAIYACDFKKGNCTDFHSLFIAIARSRGIPARFTIGFPLGTSSSGSITGYHCWAEFYAGGQWVPVDASEAWKYPNLRDYYFGHLDANRVAFTMGRDLQLQPRQHGAPLNFLIYPYVEVNGRPLPASQIKNRFEYTAIGG
jgi:transglutaminase-like putative cysteine protease